MDKFLNKRKLMIQVIKNYGVKDENILNAMLKIPRHLFVPKQFEDQAYEDYPLQIGNNQTISQPYTVAFMLQNLELKKNDKVLEIGTGSGWNAALISHLVGNKGRVYSIEVVKNLAEEAKKRLKKYRNTKIISGSGANGLKEHAPYDKIILTAAPEKLSEEIKKQLKEDG